MLEWILGTLEFQNWGLNSITISSLGTLVFTGVEGWGLTKQGRSIQEADSGESVSIISFAFFSFFLIAIFLYGFHINSISVVISGLVLGILHFKILFQLWKAEGFSNAEKGWIAISFIMIPAMIFFPEKDTVYLTIVSGTLLAIANQPWKIWINKSSGVVDIRLLMAYLASTVFWVIYAFSTKQLPLEISTSTTLVILVLTLLFWLKYKKSS